MANYNEPISGGERDRRVLFLNDCYVKTTAWQSSIIFPHLYPQLFFGDFMQHIIDLMPFIVPGFVQGKVDTRTPRATPIPLSDLSYETLDDLCNQFRSDVFKKAGKVDFSRASE